MFRPACLDACRVQFPSIALSVYLLCGSFDIHSKLRVRRNEAQKGKEKGYGEKKGDRRKMKRYGEETAII